MKSTSYYDRDDQEPGLNPGLITVLHRLTTVSGVVAIVIPALVIVGWLGHWEGLKRVFPGLVAMNPLTACCFMLAGISLLLWSDPDLCRRENKLAKVLASLVAACGVSRLGAYFLGWPLNLDQWLFPAQLAGNRMAPNTAGCLVLLGGAMLLLEVRIQRRYR